MNPAKVNQGQAHQLAQAAVGFTALLHSSDFASRLLSLEARFREWANRQVDFLPASFLRDIEAFCGRVHADRGSLLYSLVLQLAACRVRIQRFPLALFDKRLIEKAQELIDNLGARLAVQALLALLLALLLLAIPEAENDLEPNLHSADLPPLPPIPPPLTPHKQTIFVNAPNFA